MNLSSPSGSSGPAAVGKRRRKYGPRPARFQPNCSSPPSAVRAAGIRSLKMPCACGFLYICFRVFHFRPIYCVFFNHIVRATRFVVSGFPTLLILGPPLLILGPPLLILGPTLLILGPTLLILVVKMGIAIREKTQTIQTVDSGFE